MIDCDNTISINRQLITNLFTSSDKKIEACLPKERFHIQRTSIRPDVDVNLFSDEYNLAIEDIDVVILFTMTPFDNNFFFEGIDGVFLVSLAAWNQLTRVEIDVGIAYMICMIVIKHVLQIGKNHDDNCGCINDFLWDKKGIDAGMRAAYVCDTCLEISKNIAQNKKIEFEFFRSILNSISSAARSGKSLLEADSMHSETEDAIAAFDVFLCHNSEDKEIVRRVNTLLLDMGICTWFDEDQVELGDVWQDVLEESIESVNACAIFVGDSGLGPWQKKELRAFISEFADRETLLIPVLVGELENIPKLPLFLKQFQYLDLRGSKITSTSRLAKKLKSISDRSH